MRINRMLFTTTVLYCSSLWLFWYLSLTTGQFLGSEEEDNSWDGIRMYPIYTKSFENHPFAVMLKNIAVEPALEIWKAILRPKNRLPGSLVFPRNCDEHGGTEITGYGRVCKHACKQAVSCFLHTLPLSISQGCKVFTNGLPNTISSDGNGIGDFDMVVVIHVMDGDRCDDAEAFASTCQMSALDNRPLLGDIAICPAALRNGRPSEYTRDVVLHELGHLLGYSPQMFAYFLDPSGRPLTPRSPEGTPILGVENGVHISSNNTIREVIRHGLSASGPYVVKQSILVLPSVRDEARKHFNCSTLEGVPLEDGKNTQRSGYHFETRVLYKSQQSILNALSEAVSDEITRKLDRSTYAPFHSRDEDIMSTAPSPDAVISSITLAFMKDTGWYHVNEAKAQPMQWGKDAGCDFVEKSCYEVIQSRKAAKLPLAPFCEWHNFTVPACTDDGRRYKRCTLTVTRRKSAVFPKESDNSTYSSINNSSSDEDPRLVDYCPILSPDHELKSSPRISQECQTHVTESYIAMVGNDALESFGFDSICVDHKNQSMWVRKIGNQTKRLDHFGASCHQYSCSVNSGLSLKFGNQMVACPVVGGTVYIQIATSDGFLTGSVYCRPCFEVCADWVCRGAVSKDEKAVVESCQPEPLFSDQLVKREHGNEQNTTRCSPETRPRNVSTKFSFSAITSGLLTTILWFRINVISRL